MENKEKPSWLDTIGKQKPAAQPTELSFKDRLIRANAHLCYKVVGKDSTGRDAYYFILLDKNKKQAFLQHQVGDTYNLEEYGEIVYSGYGTTVPEDVLKMLQEKYGFDNVA
ncbi:hypothetical protein GCM10027299_00220 [Larkinella ripae]